MADFVGGLRGAGQGAAAGAAFGPWGIGIGAGLGALGGLFGGGDDDAAKAELERQRKLWEALAGRAPDKDPEWQEQMARLQEASKNGLDPQAKMALLEAMGQANGLARAREGAILQGEQARGGGVAQSGQTMAFQQQAAQGAAQRAQQEGMGVAAANDARRRQAQAMFLDQLAANRNFYAMTTQGQAGQSMHAQDYDERAHAAQNSNMQGFLGDAAAVGLGAYARQQQPAPNAATMHPPSVPLANLERAPAQQQPMPQAPTYSFEPPAQPVQQQEEPFAGVPLSSSGSRRFYRGVY